jgi:hypothetical protein
MLTWFRKISESKFGFWLVTTVFVGAATTGNAFLQNYFAEQQRQHTLSEHLNLEIEYRLSQFMASLAQMTDHEQLPWKLRNNYTQEDVKSLTQRLIGLPRSHNDILFFAMYPREFGKRPLASLLAEKASLHPDLANTLKNQLAYVAGGALFDHRDFTDVFTLASDVNHTLFPRNASGDFFYYTDCLAKSPLC